MQTVGSAGWKSISHAVAAKRQLKCPKCGGRELRIRERSIAYSVFEQDKNGAIPFEGHHGHDRVLGLDARCRGCDHSWKPRGVMQITDLEGYAGEPQSPYKGPSR
jgi:hypothetical protein